MPILRALFVPLALLALTAAAQAQGQPTDPESAAQPGVRTNSDPADSAARLLQALDSVDAAVGQGDWTAAQTAWRRFEDIWFEVEDGFRAASRDTYRAIEQQMDRVASALQGSARDSEAILGETRALRALIQPMAPAASTPTLPVGPEGLAPSPSSQTVSAIPAAARTPAPAAIPTRTPLVTAIPATCSTPSLTLDPPFLRSDGVIDWRAHGFKPGTLLHIAVLGPTQSGSVSGPVVARLESQPVDRSCSARSDEGLAADELLEDSPALPTGHYVLEVRGIRWTAPDSHIPESEMRINAPFNFYNVAHP
ncbi:MAG TPA: hypothetical protein VFC51_03035 [Chloroflexota bacterium]|nr:hypothetical protein [Chloroflexota bacterium]